MEGCFLKQIQVFFCEDSLLFLCGARGKLKSYGATGRKITQKLQNLLQKGGNQNNKVIKVFTLHVAKRAFFTTVHPAARGSIPNGGPLGRGVWSSLVHGLLAGARARTPAGRSHRRHLKPKRRHPRREKEGGFLAKVGGAV